MILGEAKYTTATSESIDTFSGFSKIECYRHFPEYHSDFKVTIKGNNESNIIRINGRYRENYNRRKWRY